MNQFQEFIRDLTGPQVRALSSQSGIQGWHNTPVSELREELSGNMKAAEVWANAYL